MATMSYVNWLNLVRSAEKTSVISGNARKIHYKFPGGKEMAEEYSLETGVVLRRAWKKSRELMGEPQWELELGEPVRLPQETNTSGFVLRESTTEPALTKRITKRNIEWRIRNLPYPIDTYSVSADSEKNAIIVRTTNKKFFKTIAVPELERCGLLPIQSNISINHQYNTLIITYKKPELLCEMEVAVLKELKNVETETDMDDLLKDLMENEPGDSCTKAKLIPELPVELPNKTTATTPSNSETNSKTAANEAIQPDKIVELETQPVITILATTLDKKPQSAAELKPTNRKHENSTSDEPLEKQAKYYLLQDGNVEETSYELCFNPDQTVDEIDPTRNNNSDNSTILNYLEKIDSRLDSLDRRMERFGRELRQIKKKCNQTEDNTVELYEIYSNLPLKSELDVEFLEKELTQNKGKYIALLKYLKKIKESSHHSQYVRKCLYSIFDDNITTCYNWSGKGDKNKKAVSDLIIMRIIHEAVESCFENVTKRTTELVMMRWFRYGPQRLSRSKDHKQEDDEFVQVITFID